MLAIGDSNLKRLRVGYLAGLVDRNAYIKKFAYWGATARHLRHYIDIGLESKPEIVIIHGGTNDIAGSNKNDHHAKHVASELIQTAVKAKENGVREVYISSVLAVRNPAEDSRGKEVNRYLKAFCREENITFVDNSNISTGFLEEEDNVHLNGWGCKELTKNFAHYLNY